MSFLTKLYVGMVNIKHSVSILKEKDKNTFKNIKKLLVETITFHHHSILGIIIMGLE